MTKEEIREKYLYANGLSVNNGPVGKRIQKAAFDAMDEYAKDRSIAFADWKVKEGWESATTEREVWFNMDYNERLTTSELYNLFEQSTDKP